MPLGRVISAETQIRIRPRRNRPGAEGRRRARPPAPKPKRGGYAPVPAIAAATRARLAASRWRTRRHPRGSPDRCRVIAAVSEPSCSTPFRRPLAGAARGNAGLARRVRRPSRGRARLPLVRAKTHVDDERSGEEEDRDDTNAGSDTWRDSRLATEARAAVDGSNDPNERVGGVQSPCRRSGRRWAGGGGFGLFHPAGERRQRARRHLPIESTRRSGGESISPRGAVAGGAYASLLSLYERAASV